MTMLARFRRGTVLLAASLATLALGIVPSQPTAGAQTAPSFGFYIDAPFVQTAYYTLSDQSNVQTFNSLSTGSSASPSTWPGISKNDGVVGTWKVVAGDEWGGATTTLPPVKDGVVAFGDPQLVADESTRSQYGIIEKDKSLAIDLVTPASCLGFWWSGGDPFNEVQFFTTDASGNQDLVATITTGALTERLKNSDGTVAGVKVAALSGVEYDAIGFYGHPVTNGTPATSRKWGPSGTIASGAGTNLYPYLFVHAIAQGGVTFDRLVLSQTGSGGFEFDNLTLSTGCAVKQSLVLIAEVLNSDFAQRFLAAQAAANVVASPTPTPTLSCTPSPLVAGSSAECSVHGGPEDFDVLWNASLGGGAFAGQGVRLDGSGRGTFTFMVPASAAGQEISVELVGWLAPVSLGVVGGVVPASIPAGSGSTVPVGLVLFGLLVVAGSGVAVRRMAQAG
jgi:hypothetical protein